LPEFVSWLAYLTPIWHGVELCRALTTGSVDALAAGGHLVYIAAFIVVGWRLTLTGFARRLGV
jgi:lipooligosaccharide transport system permease protein